MDTISRRCTPMSRILLRLYILLCWIIGRGPWVVVGQYYDDDGNLCRYRTGYTGTDRQWNLRSWDSLDDANDYCEMRNWQSVVDPLDTTFYVWHEKEFNHFHDKVK